ncbi:MAG: GNAT family N-acetyltransferase [Coxiellaceae bacterium]|jgi:ribosomal protein S18 acetylase RimI-like enzyme|nr:GNAT family N-acetyltransferase [Coxiellaceae bacterium]
MEYQILQFDTKLFGFKVAKILPSKLLLTKLKSILDKLRAQQIRLVYWQADGANKLSQKAIRNFQGLLSCKPVTYAINLNKSMASQTSPEVKIYRSKKPTPEMQQLAVAISTLSRFGIDPKMPKKLMQKMYQTWLKNSVNNIAADQVLVIKNKHKVAGMITLSTKKKRGDIRLLAVASSCRGKKFGTKLVQAAKNYFIKKGFSKLQVVTQKSNIPACHLYKKCGFSIESIDNFYHFWL